jgi:signal transduction histidine kinase
MGSMNPRTAAWLAWSVCALSMALTVLSFLLFLLTLSHSGAPIYLYWAENTLLAVGYSAVGAVVASRRPENPVGWLLCAIGLLWGVIYLSGEYATYTLLVIPAASLPASDVAAWIYSWLWVPGLGLFAFLGLLFPTGRLPSRRWLPFAWLSVLSILVGSVMAAFSPGPIDVGLEPIRNPLGIESLPTVYEPLQALMLSLIFVAAASLLVRLPRARGMEREQIKWITYAAAVAASASILRYMVFEAIDVLWLEIAAYALVVVGIFGVPAAVGMAILRYRLYDIDLLINRTLVYGTLTASVVALYVLVVGALVTLFREGSSLAVSLVAAGIIAVLFAPLREKLQRGVNRLMYGERDDPYAVLSRLGRRLEATIAPKAALETIVETVAQALKVPYVAIDLNQEGDEFETVAEHGILKGEPLLLLPLIYQRETVGQLLVAPRAPGETFSTADRRLLEDLARQVEVAVHAVRLTADLQRSRERLVTTREEERRRLRRDLHDGLGPTLGYLTLGLDTARRLFAQDPKSAERLLLELKAKTQEAVSDVRRLVYDLRPPALDDLGLVPAIREQAANHGLLLAEEIPNSKGPGEANGNNSINKGLVFKVEAPNEGLPSLPAAVEVACYRIAQEAIANASRHSGASSCRVSLSLNGDNEQTLALEVADDGVGIPEDRSAGVGMSSMRERAEELGGTLSVDALPQEGGTRVLARFPLAESGEEE